MVDKIINDKLQNDSESKLNPISNIELINQHIDLQVAQLGDPRVTNLTELNLHNCGLTDLDMESLKVLTQLKKLVLSFNKLKFIKEIANLTNLDYLDVSYNQIESITGFKVRIFKIIELNFTNKYRNFKRCFE